MHTNRSTSLFWLPRVCATCGQDFFARTCAVRDGGGKFCSSRCYHQRPQPTPEESFWAKVQKTDGCWLWTGAHLPKGYGNFHIGGEGNWLTHRLSWVLHFGPIPDGLLVLHNCPGGDNPRCVNPAHLFLGTNKDNAIDGVSKGQFPLGELVKHAKLTNEQVSTIRRRYDAGGVSCEALAREYGISGGQMWRIVARKNWKHLP